MKPFFFLNLTSDLYLEFSDDLYHEPFLGGGGGGGGVNNISPLIPRTIVTSEHKVVPPFLWGIETSPMQAFKHRCSHRFKKHKGWVCELHLKLTFINDDNIMSCTDYKVEECSQPRLFTHKLPAISNSPNSLEQRFFLQTSSRSEGQVNLCSMSC